MFMSAKNTQDRRSYFEKRRGNCLLWFLKNSKKFHVVPYSSMNWFDLRGEEEGRNKGNETKGAINFGEMPKERDEKAELRYR